MSVYTLLSWPQERTGRLARATKAMILRNILIGNYLPKLHIFYYIRKYIASPLCLKRLYLR